MRTVSTLLSGLPNSTIYLQLQFLDKIRRASGFETVPAGSMRLGDDVVVSGYRIEALIGFDHVRDTLPVDQ